MELESEKGPKDKKALKLAEEAYRKKSAEYNLLFVSPREEPLKKAFDLKQEQKRAASKLEKKSTEEIPKVSSNKAVPEEDPSNGVTKSDAAPTPPPQTNPILDDLLLLFPSEPSMPAFKNIVADPFGLVEPVSKLEAGPTLSISTLDVETPLTTRKKAIPKHIKTLVWNTHVGVENLEAKCFSCRVEKIDARYFQCGHVIAESKGGDLTIKNLRPICGPCNSSMGTKSMNEFTKEYFGWEV
jgi:5-methylcytosine-specific restriction endonuclease McrA